MSLQVNDTNHLSPPPPHPTPLPPQVTALGRIFADSSCPAANQSCAPLIWPVNPINHITALFQIYIPSCHPDDQSHQSDRCLADPGSCSAPPCPTTIMLQLPTVTHCHNALIIKAKKKFQWFKLTHWQSKPLLCHSTLPTLCFSKPPFRPKPLCCTASQDFLEL